MPLAERGGGGYNRSIMIKTIDQDHDLSNNTKIYIQIYYGKIVIYKYLINWTKFIKWLYDIYMQVKFQLINSLF